MFLNANLSLFSICVPSSIVSLCERSFSCCCNLSFVAFEYGSRLSVIEGNAFMSCGLKSICIPAGVQILTEYSFISCSDLGSVVFENHSRLSSIQSKAFCDCHHLQSIRLPAGLESIGPEALVWSSLGCIGIETGNQHFTISGGCLLVFEGTSIVGHSGSPTEVWITNGIAELCEWAFASCSLRSIVIPSSVEIIREDCFYDCSDLSIVRFEPDSRLSVLEEDAFAYCDALETIWIPFHLQALFLGEFESSPSVDDPYYWHKFQVIIIETGFIIDSYVERMF
jgi:hypothetical protein